METSASVSQKCTNGQIYQSSGIAILALSVVGVSAFALSIISHFRPHFMSLPHKITFWTMRTAGVSIPLVVLGALLYRHGYHLRQLEKMEGQPSQSAPPPVGSGEQPPRTVTPLPPGGGEQPSHPAEPTAGGEEQPPRPVTPLPPGGGEQPSHPAEPTAGGEEQSSRAATPPVGSGEQPPRTAPSPDTRGLAQPAANEPDDEPFYSATEREFLSAEEGEAPNAPRQKTVRKKRMNQNERDKLKKQIQEQEESVKQARLAWQNASKRRAPQRRRELRHAETYLTQLQAKLSGSIESDFSEKS